VHTRTLTHMDTHTRTHNGHTHHRYQTAVKTTFFERKTRLHSLNDQGEVLIPWCEEEILSQVCIFVRVSVCAFVGLCVSVCVCAGLCFRVHVCVCKHLYGWVVITQLAVRQSDGL
jgi:hypothetical protein